MKQKINIFKKISFGMVFIVLCFVTFSIGTDNLTPSSGKIILSADTWKSNLVQIDDYVDQNDVKYVNINSLVLVDEDGLVTSVRNPNEFMQDNQDVIILINDGLDVYYFSEICNRKFANGSTNDYYSSYLTFHYELGADINYEDASKTFKMLRPIAWADGESFSGIFDGNGHTISNLFYRPFDNVAEVENDYPGMIYLSWFSQNTGTIKNLGLIDPNVIQYDVYDHAIFVSPFVGSNNGIVEYCYVQDLRGNEAGISAEGGYEISMFVSSNLENGIIRDCYVAANRVAATTVTLSATNQKHPVIMQNNNENGIVNCYYDIEALTKYGSFNDEQVNGIIPLNTHDFLDEEKFAYDVDGHQMWYSSVTYPATYAAYFRETYPILMGFDVNNDGYFLIETPNQLVYMSELIDQYQIFRETKYLLMNTVDLKTVKPNSFVFTQNVFSGVLKGGPKANDGYNVRHADGTLSDKNAILNLTIDKGNSYQGYHAYGLFSILAGTVENINIVHATINQNDLTSVNLDEINTIGTICGLLDGGTIKDVNVYSSINLQQGTSTKFLGTENVGGICGTALKGSIIDSTTNGKINSPSYTPTSNNMDEKYSHSIGGILGKALGNDSVSNCLNNMQISAITYTSNPGNQIKQYIGGVIGSGHINNTFELQNNADINIGEQNTNAFYSKTYVGGIIGKVSNATESNGVYYNNADIRYYVNDNNYKAYISGIMNVIYEEIDKYDTFNTATAYDTIQQTINEQTPFEFTSLTSGGTLYIENNLTTSKYPAKYSVITTINNGIDIRAAGLVYSYLTKLNVVGAYNLDKHYEWQAGEFEEIKNEPQSIDMSLMDEFAPTFNADNKAAFVNDRGVNELHLDTNYLPANSNTVTSTTPIISSSINLERVYNYRNINYITRKSVYSYMLNLSGCVHGYYFNYKNIRNDGDIKVYFSNETYTGMTMDSANYYNYFGDYKKLKVYGVMEEISMGYRAEDIYNGGNITISSAESLKSTTAGNVNFNLYISGICYKNIGNDDSENQPLMIESGYKGSLHNCINNGEIRITNGDILNSNPTTQGYFYGVSRIGGIASFNCSTISQTFNLGDIYNINNVFTDSATYGTYFADFEVETGGICFVMQNETIQKNNNNVANSVYTRANIIDSANNGTIVSMNTNANTSAWTNAGGFVGRNDRGEDGDTVDRQTTSLMPHLQKIQYSINYGDIYAYNAYSSDSATNSNEPQSKSAGFVCLGACAVVDVINYGNIYGSKVVSGMFGHIYYPRMRDAGVTVERPVYIANAINYGIVDTITISNNNVNALYNIGTTGTIATTNRHTTGQNSTHYPIGALIGMIYGDNQADDLQSMNIKNLVNFNDAVDIIGRTTNMRDVNNNIKVEALRYTATTKNADYSPAPFNTDRTAPYDYGIKSYSKDTATGDKTLSDIWSKAYNGGIFNIDYTLRTPPAYTDENGNVVTDISLANKNNTDNFIADYIQFVPYSKVNDYLVEKIGLKNTVLLNAWNLAVNSESVIKNILEKKYGNTLGALEGIYDELLRTEQVKLNSSKTEIIQILAREIQKGTITSSDLQEIVNLLTNNGTNLDNISNDSINSIYQSILLDDELLNTQVGNENKKVLDVLYDYLIEHQDVFVLANGDVNDPINSILNEFAQNANTDQEKQLVINIYNSLINDDDSLQAFIDNLSDVEKETLANSIYDTVKGNEQVIEAIANEYYDDINIIDNTELNKLVQNVITPRLSSNGELTNYPIADQEYMNMYNSFLDVEAKINSFNSEQLADFIDLLRDTIENTSSNLYQFVESGRSNTTGIILPVSETNFIAIVNTNNHYTYVSSDPVDEFENNYAYTGDYSNITTRINKTAVYIAQSTNQVKLYYVQNNRYFYHTWEARNTRFTGQRANNPNGIGNDSYIVLSSDQNVTLNNGSQYVPTGVFADRTENTNNRYNYSNLEYGTYIDYGSTAVVKGDGNLTLKMLDLMYDYANSNQNVNNVKTYLINLYKNSQFSAGKNDFIELLFGNTANSLKDALNYIISSCLNANATESTEYAEYILTNISNPTAQANIVKLFRGDKGSSYINILSDMLKVYGTSSYDVIKNYVSRLYQTRINSNTAVLNNNIVEILKNSEPSDEEKLDVIQYYDYLEFEKYVIGYSIANNLLNDQEIALLFLELLNSDITLLNNSNLKQYFNDDIYASISATIIKGNETLFKKYSGFTSSETIIEDLINLGVDPSIVTDNTGIYALASSHGILNGLFLPDNIELIKMDEYYTDAENNLINDPEWRGGTPDNPNSYNSNDVDSVNYKVYYEMKQLKKSIATIIFNMELVDNGVDNEGNQLEYENVLTNNTETDYFCNEKDQYGNVVNEVYFYVPINHNILSKPNIYINMTPGSYELSYGATFDVQTNEFKIDVLADLNVGDVLSDTFVVQAEDVTVKTEYTLYLVITKASYLDPLSGVLVDGNNANYDTVNTTVQGSDVVTSDATVTTSVRGYNGTIRLTYTTHNLINRMSLLPFVKVYSTNSNNIAAALNDKVLLVLDEQYKFNDVEDNGLVIIPGYDEDDTGYNSATNAYDNGTVMFDLSIDNHMLKGYYLIEVALNDTTKYYVLFEKAASTNAALESITYMGTTYNEGGNSNANRMSIHPYGTVLTQSDLTTIEDSKPNYLDEIVIAPLAKYVIDSATFTETNGVKTYQIVYTITAEDGITKSTFTHYITEDVYQTYIDKVYIDGGVSKLGPITAPDSGYIYSGEFSKNEVPSYKFEYNLIGFYTTETSEYFKVRVYDSLGNEIVDQAILNQLNSYYSTNVNEGNSFEVSFYEDAASMDYYFALVYENSVPYNGTDDLEWEVLFDIVKLTKMKNTNSYFDNITFLSESVVSSIRTMITTNDITIDEYDEMLKDPTREIVSLPGRIHYNQYAIDVNKQAEFYTIGLVSKTQLDYYVPTFTLPEGGSVYRIELLDDDGDGNYTDVYRYVPYYIESQQELTAFLIREDGNSIRDEHGVAIQAIVNGTSIIYNEEEYKLSDVAGKQYIEIGNTTIENTTLRTDYNEFGSFDETLNKFKYVTYRVYSEIYEYNTSYGTGDYYTDYNIATQDLTNNIRFNIIIDYADGCKIAESIYNVYVEFTCFALPEGLSDIRENYSLYNRAGLFAYFDNDNVLSHEALQANISGYYGVYVALANGFKYSFVVTDRGVTTSYEEGEEFNIASSIIARTVEIHITIENDTVDEDDWGVHVKDESFVIPSVDE